MALRRLDDDATRRALAHALSAHRGVIFTSPAAVRLCGGAAGAAAEVAAIGVGQGTVRALQRAGVAHADRAARQDSEGVLALPQLQHLRRACAWR